MKYKIRLIGWLALFAGLLAACASSPTPATGTIAASPTPGTDTVEVEASRDRVFTITADENQRRQLPSPQQTFLRRGEGVDVDERGRAIVRFADLLTVEVLRNGGLSLEELSVDEQAAFITVLHSGGALINNFNPKEEIDRRFTIKTEFAIIEATGTRFVVVREANAPLEWVIGWEADPEDLTVTAAGVTKPVPSGVARWIAPIDEPSAGIPVDMGALEGWVEGLREGVDQPAIGEVVWPQADVVGDTEPLTELPEPGQPFELEGVRLILDPQGLVGNPEYWLEDCNGDGVRDIAMMAGKLHMDFRPVLARVRGLDVTVINRNRPGTGALRVLDPGRKEIAQQAITVGPGEGQVLSLRSDVPYHYAELLMTEGCFLGFSLTPPQPDGEPAPPRPAVPDWEGERLPPTLTPTPTPTRTPTPTPTPTPTLPPPPPETGERPLQNGLLEALPLSAYYYYEVAIEIDGSPEDWWALQEISERDWVAFDTVVFDNGCAKRAPLALTRFQPDLLGRVFFAYDDTYLYVAFEVEDDKYVSYSGSDQRYFLGDAPQLLLDTDLLGDFYDTGLSADDLQVDLFPGEFDRDDVYISRAGLWRLDTLRSRLFREARVAAVSTETGYFVEAALPWKYLGVVPEPGTRLGIAVSVSDNDTPKTDVQECMISTAPKRDWRNPTTWGTLVLGVAPYAPSVYLYSGGGPLADERVQYAVLSVMPLVEMAESFLNSPDVSVISVDLDTGRETDARQVPYDPEVGRKLLAEAGYPEGFDLLFLVSSEDEALVGLADEMVGWLAEAGIVAELVVVPSEEASAKSLGVVEAGEPVLWLTQ